ncbi:hypothetical protein GCM10027589_01790 [Actinocorallia lasiicapitis]
MAETPRWTLPALFVVAPLTLGLAATRPGAAFAARAQDFLLTYAGVFALVAFSLTVMIGLMATDRSLLSIRYRVLAQAGHRTTSTVGMTFLVAHLMVKILAGRASAADAVVFGVGPIGLGALAFDLFMIVLLSGVTRFWFAAGTRPGLWRGLHALSYVAWPVAIMHGLTAGRAAAGWVVWSYVLCLVFVGLALLNRVVLVVRPVDPVREGEPEPAPAPARARSREQAREGEQTRSKAKAEQR